MSDERMYTEKELQQEISDIVNGRIAQKVRIPADSVALQIIQSHMGDFHRGESYLDYCLWSATRKAVGNYLARITKDDDGEMRQLRMPGFECLQRYYVVQRGDKDVAVPTGLLSYNEITAVGHRLEREGHTKLKHAKEVFDYRDTHLGKTPDDEYDDD